MCESSQCGGRSREHRATGPAGTMSDNGGVALQAAGMYDKISAFSIDREGDAFPFSARLARENGWTVRHALRVIEEYRRFVCLMATAPHPVTPSEAVDQAWHLHMTYTRSYWEGLCRDVIGRPLHHEPTRGGRDENAKFADWYARTLETYRTVFGEAPPADLWPAPAERFAPSRMQWVDLATNRLVPIGPDRRWRWGAMLTGSVAAVAAGCSAVSGGGSQVLPALGMMAVFLFLMMLIGAVSRRRRRRGGGGGAAGSSGFFGGCTSGCAGDSGCGGGDGGGGCGGGGCGGG